MSATTPRSATSTTLGFQTSPEELTIDALEIDGEIPAWLTGSLLRTGPARFEVGRDTMRHWFDGFAKLHRFSFEEGSVSYASRFLQSDAHTSAQRDGRLAYREFATDPCRSAFKRVQSVLTQDQALTDNANVNVVPLGDRWLALTETPMAVEFDPQTLESRRVEQPRPGDHTTAHPHDGGNGEWWGHAVRFGPRNEYLVYAMGPSGQRTVAKIPVKRPAYHHSFALTATRAILAEGPWSMNPLKFVVSKGSFAEAFEWRPQDRARFLAVDRATGGHAGTWTADPFFCFHHVNAFEDGEDLVIDLLAYEDASIVEALSLQRLRDGEPIPTSELRRYRLKPGGGHASYDVIGDVRFELPVIDYRAVNTKPYRYVWGVAGQGDGFFAHVVKVDVTTGETREWADPGAFPGEPILAKRPGATEEDDGVILTVVLEPERQASSLAVLDAATLTEIGRARVPQHIPFSFHGMYSARP